mmetsp:Transcript_11261/g.52320  ORF Transcript_11261/g.52320 Transcript_11261/m.52320 type:complete len:276 (-) Transcript_11261:3651-4478(-)
MYDWISSISSRIPRSSASFSIFFTLCSTSFSQSLSRISSLLSCSGSSGSTGGSLGLCPSSAAGPPTAPWNGSTCAASTTLSAAAAASSSPPACAGGLAIIAAAAAARESAPLEDLSLSAARRAAPARDTRRPAARKPWLARLPPFSLRTGFLRRLYRLRSFLMTSSSMSPRARMKFVSSFLSCSTHASSRFCAASTVAWNSTTADALVAFFSVTSASSTLSSSSMRTSSSAPTSTSWAHATSHDSSRASVASVSFLRAENSASSWSQVLTMSAAS